MLVVPKISESGRFTGDRGSDSLVDTGLVVVLLVVMVMVVLSMFTVVAGERKIEEGIYK